MNLMFWSKGSDDDHRDPQVGAWLSEVDPGRDDASYWMRFHRDVIVAGQYELVRRRVESEATVVGLVSAWSRALVPAALAAAAAAGIMLAQPNLEAADSPIFVEEVLSLGLGNPIPALSVEVDGDDADGIVLASEIY